MFDYSLDFKNIDFRQHPELYMRQKITHLAQHEGK